MLLLIVDKKKSRHKNVGLPVRKIEMERLSCSGNSDLFKGDEKPIPNYIFSTHSVSCPQNLVSISLNSCHGNHNLTKLITDRAYGTK